jgi:hypothetical protein
MLAMAAMMAVLEALIFWWWDAVTHEERFAERIEHRDPVDRSVLEQLGAQVDGLVRHMRPEDFVPRSCFDLWEPKVCVVRVHGFDLNPGRSPEHLRVPFLCVVVWRGCCGFGSMTHNEPIVDIKQAVSARKIAYKRETKVQFPNYEATTQNQKC